MLVVLILLAVALSPVWGHRVPSPLAYVVTAAGWVAAMAIVLVSGTVDDVDAGFWIFNSLLLAVALALTFATARRRVHREAVVR